MESGLSLLEFFRYRSAPSKSIIHATTVYGAKSFLSNTVSSFSWTYNNNLMSTPNLMTQL